MQESEFRQRALANPRDEGADFQAALAASEERRRFVAELRDLDARLRVPVPPTLKQALLALPAQPGGAVHALPAADFLKGLRWNQWLAAAASLLVAFTLGLSLGRPPLAERALGAEILTHVHREAHWHQLEDQVNAETLSRFVAAVGDFRRHPQAAGLELEVASDCWIDQALTAHLVLRDDQDPLSVLLIPSTPVDREFTFEDERFHGIVLPHPEGNLVLLAEKPEPVARYRPVFAALGKR